MSRARGVNWQSDMSGLVLFLGSLYLIYSSYYAYRRYEPHHQKKMHKFWQDMKMVHDNFADPLPDSPDVTLVTAFFNIGSFQKGSIIYRYTPDMYLQWMQIFKYVKNPLIVFTDDTTTGHTFQDLRKDFQSNFTRIFVVKRTELWSFSLAKEIHQIFTQPNYPTHQPNTVNENYSCVMHAKFELVSHVIERKLYNTKYLSWLDIGLFRDVSNQHQFFQIQVPPFLDDRKIAYSEVFEFDSSLTPRKVIEGNLVWVGGAMFLGRPKVLFKHTQEYMVAIRKLLHLQLMSTDQQVIYSMYLPSFNFTPSVSIQTYTTHSHKDWFYLGYLIKELWDKKRRERKGSLMHIFLSYL